MISVISNIKRASNVAKALMILFLIGQSSAILSSYVTAVDYCVVAITVICFLLYSRRINRFALVVSVTALAILLIGMLYANMFTSIKNDNYPLCLALSALMFSVINFSFELSKDSFRERDLYALFDFILIIGLLSCIYNFAININEILNVFSAASPTTSFSSFYGNRNTFSGLLFVYNALAAFCYCKRRQMLYLLYIGVFLLSTIITFSRTGIICTTIFYVLFLNLFSKGNVRIKLIVTIGLLLVAGIIVYAFHTHYGFWYNNLFRPGSGDSTRLTYWSIACDYIGQSVLFGYGAGSTEFILSIYRARSLENAYIELALWGGLLYLAINLLITLLPLRYLKKEGVDSRTFYVFYIAILIAYLIRCITESTTLIGMGPVSHAYMLVMLVIPLLYSRVEGSKAGFYHF